GGDVSYYNLGIYRIPSSNPTREVSLSFIGTYFDTHTPRPISRPGARVTTRDCTAAASTNYSAPVIGASLSPQDLFVSSRLFNLSAKGGVNLIANGDFRERHNVGYSGSGKPLWGRNDATVSRRQGGMSGFHLNINQAKTSSNMVSFSAIAT